MARAQCGAHTTREGLSNRCFTDQDIPVEEVTSSPPNGPEDSGPLLHFYILQNRLVL